VMTQAERVCMVESCRYVDEVVWEGPKQLSQKFMDEHGYDRYVFACVDDQELKIKEVDCGDLPKERYQAVPYTQGISTTLLKERVRRSLA
jgi:glycerol-3-phosphate cytidylyltransferase-like family protein